MKVRIMKSVKFAPRLAIIGSVGLATPALVPDLVSAQDLSEGCRAANTIGSLAVATGTKAFNAGDTIKAVFNAGGPGAGTLSISGVSSPENKNVTTTSTAPVADTEYTFLESTASGSVSAVIAPSGTITLSCVAGGSELGSGIGQAAAQAVTQATLNVISGRIQGLFSPTGTPSLEPSGVQTEAGVAGGSGQGSGDPVGVWGNIGYTGRNSSERGARSGTDVITGVAGADIVFGDSAIVGGAFALSWVDSDTPNNAFQREEFSMTFAPYAAYAIDDVFAVDGSIGYTLGLSDTERVAGAAAVTGDATNHSYFLSANASARKYWGGFGLLGAAGVLWSQSFQGGYTESDGTTVAAATADLGSLNARIQPSYLIEADSVLIEPYAGLGYTYDYKITPIAGTANDRGQMDVKAGVNLFGDGVMGGVEANTGLFRENERRTNISGTLRMNF